MENLRFGGFFLLIVLDYLYLGLSLSFYLFLFVFSFFLPSSGFLEHFLEFYFDLSVVGCFFVCMCCVCVCEYVVL